MDDLKKQTLVLKEKYLEYYFSILHDFLKMFSSFELYPCKNVTKYSLFQNFLFISEKTFIRHAYLNGLKHFFERF